MSKTRILIRLLGKDKGHPITVQQGPRGGRSIALLILNLGTRTGWVVSVTPRPLYPREIPGTHCTGGWVGPRAGLDVCEKLAPTGIRSPDRPTRSQSLYRLSYRAHLLGCYECIFCGTGISAQLCQNFGISWGGWGF
jgi:hypothetical protein